MMPQTDAQTNVSSRILKTDLTTCSNAPWIQMYVCTWVTKTKELRFQNSMKFSIYVNLRLSIVSFLGMHKLCKNSKPNWSRHVCVVILTYVWMCRVVQSSVLNGELLSCENRSLELCPCARFLWKTSSLHYILFRF